jgi:hypothetical protein
MKKFSVLLACVFMIIAFLGCSGDTSGDPTSRIALAVSPADGVEPGGNAIITATVARPGGATTTTTDGSTTATTDKKGWGETVTFRLLTANGARLSKLSQETDGNGIATTVYTAGNNYKQDVVEAVLENGMSASVVIVKTGNVAGAAMTLTVDPTKVTAGGYSVVKATVTYGTDTGKPMSGETVEFSLIQNNSGGALLSGSAVTDAAGQATATYRAGSREPAQDVVQARLVSTGAVSTVVIEVAAGAAGRVIASIEADPATVSPSGASTITVKVTDGTASALPVAGEVVSLSFVSNRSGGRLVFPSNVTDAQGRVTATYIAGTTGSVTDVIQARLLSGGSAQSVIITVGP